MLGKDVKLQLTYDGTDRWFIEAFNTATDVPNRYVVVEGEVGHPKFMVYYVPYYSETDTPLIIGFPDFQNALLAIVGREEYLLTTAKKRSSPRPVCMVPDCGCSGYAHA